SPMTLTLHTLTRAACLALAMSTLAACPEAKSETDSATDATTTSAEQTTTTTTGDVPTTSESTVSPTSIGTLTEAMSGTGTTSPTTEGTTANTTVDVETTTASTTEGTTEGTSTTGAIPEELEGACQSACDKFFECIPQPPFPDLDTCVAECAGALGMGPTCLEHTVAFNSCIGEMSCDELEDAFVNEEFGPCEDEFAAMG